MLNKASEHKGLAKFYLKPQKASFLPKKGSFRECFALFF